MDWLDALNRDGHALSVAARHDPTAAVPACEGWNVDDLLRHIGGVHHRTALVVAERRTERPDRTEYAAPHGNALGWYEMGLANLLDVLRTTDPEQPCWTFVGTRPARWWQRRMAHETAIHRLDAEQATGGIHAFDAAFAVDGVGEALELASYRPHADDAGPGTVHLHATDVEGEWLVTFGERLTITEGHAKGDAAVRGPAEHLYRWLWGRAPQDGLEVFGDQAAVDRLRARTSL
jgi:uncharacterized protein (TIGR03083 family)